MLGKKRGQILATGLLIGAMLLLAGCGGSGGSDTRRDPTVTFVNAISDSSTGIDWTADKGDQAAYKSISGQAYQASSGAITVDAADYSVNMSAHLGEVLDSRITTLAKAQDWVEVAIGEVNVGSDLAIKRAQIMDPFTVNRLPLTGNRARLILVNALNLETGIEPTPIDVRNPGDNPVNSVSNIGYGATSSLELDSGTQSLEVRQNGTENVFVNAADYSLAPGHVYLGIVSGIKGDTTNPPTVKLFDITLN